MRRDSLKGWGFMAFVIIIAFSLPVFAANDIQIKVEIKENSAAAVGFMVEGQSFGGMGKSFSGKGPKNKKYIFGFRKNSIIGTDIRCGELILNKNSRVILRVKGNKCVSKVI
ncbi:MAG: hypothetical protein EPN84_04145 [Legionella sp.]|nr:MAG: hypothetical protein EPN84_04145 [Legionella sp.]